MKIAKVGVIGCGNRGSAYADYIANHPEEAQLVCACDILSERLAWYGERYQLPVEMCFEDVQTMLDTVSGLDLVIVSVLDIDHFRMAKMVMERGIHCMLEKPISPDPWECMELMNIAKTHDCQLLICHVLRYTPLFSALKEVLEEGSIGEIQAINHAEFVGYEHFNHSYVRGNFRNLSPFILAKACHDLDILNWLTGKKCLKISSFGELNYFKKENAPEGSAERCLECSIEPDCVFSAKKRYLGEYTGWPVAMISVDTSLEAREKALAEGKYGRCVFHCDNKVVDRQVVNMLYEDGVTVSFTLNGFNSVGFRETRIFGTKGDILANFGEEFIRVRIFGEPGEKVIHPEGFEGGHGGGDYCMMKDIIRCVREDKWEGVRTGADQSVASHIMAFAAEKSRKNSIIVDIEEFKQEIIAEHDKVE